MSFAVGDDEDRVRTNRQRFVERLGVSPESVIAGRLTHGNEVSVFSDNDCAAWPIAETLYCGESSQPDRWFPSDGVVSNVPGLHFLLTFADCVPLAFVDRRSGAIGAAHAGWRGTAKGIAREVVRAMEREFGSNPADLAVAIGPSIGPCCYSVKPEVVGVFATNAEIHSVAYPHGTPMLDLWETNRLQVLDSGVQPDSIEIARVCTACHTETYYSHRGESGRTGRFAMCIGLS